MLAENYCFHVMGHIVITSYNHMINEARERVREREKERRRGK